MAMQFAYQFPDQLGRLVLVDSGGLGNEVASFLRAATLPGAEYVIPLLFSSPARPTGRAVGSVLGKLGVRPQREHARDSPREWSRWATPTSGAPSSTPRGR